jgi:PHD/YefM family antitoxin component YafN of YafNO toxin-antitoxin module
VTRSRDPAAAAAAGPGLARITESAQNLLSVWEKIISITDLVRNTASIAREVETEGTVYRITRGGRGSMVLVDEQYFNGWLAALDEMRRPDWREVHDRTTRDIAAGRGRDLDRVAKELGLEGRSHAARRNPARRPARTGRKKAR